MDKIPMHLKMVLTIREAAEHSNIGINKIDSMLRQSNAPSFSTLEPGGGSSARHLKPASAASGS